MRRLTLPALLATVTLSGCRNPSPTMVFHTLTPTAPLSQEKQAWGLEIMPVQLPELLQRSPIVLRTGTGTHRLSGTHRWGNTLEKDLQRVLAENLAALLGTTSVVPYPQGDSVKAAFRISLDVSRCDGEPGGTLHFRGTWMIQKSGTGELAALRKTILDEPVSTQDMQDLVAAHDRVLEKLSLEIARELRALIPKP
jgi:hypothetical protein